jgi:hypothetical protein
MRKMKNVFLFILTTFLFLSQQRGYAFDSEANTYAQILANESYCVKGYDNDKVYLNPENIHTTDQGLLIEVQEGLYMPLSYLQADNTGCYIPMATGFEIFNKCPQCGESYFVTCRNPNCPSNQKEDKED